MIGEDQNPAPYGGGLRRLWTPEASKLVPSIIREDGSAWDDDPGPPSRPVGRGGKFLDKAVKRLLRARAFLAFHAEGYTLAQVGEILRFSTATVSTELRWLSSQSPPGRRPAGDEWDD